jgi:Flp pilus assembly pilin Flp
VLPSREKLRPGVILLASCGRGFIEYGPIAALISVVCIAGMVLVGNGLTGVYNSVSAAITPAL